MFKIYIFFIIFVFGFINSYAQVSCDQIMEHVKSEGSREASFCCFKSEFLTGVQFYSLDIEGETYYFSIVQFNYGKWYIYQVPRSSRNNFSLYAFGDQAGEAFHKFIHAYRNSLGCAPEF